MTTHALYRFYDAEGALLYIGITMNPAARWKQHADEKPWWSEVAHITVESHPDREAVLAAERASIRRDRPRYNVVHNRGSRPIRKITELNDGMLALVGADPADGPWGSRADHMPDDCHDLCVPAGWAAMYYPFRWRAGTAFYQCVRGHSWTCGWGHERSGDAPEWRGVDALDRVGKVGSFQPTEAFGEEAPSTFPQVTTQKVHPQVRERKGSGLETSNLSNPQAGLT